MKLFDRTAADLLQNGRAEFYCPMRALLVEVMDGWKELIRFSTGNRARWAVDRSAFEARQEDRDQGLDDGLVCREGGENVVNGDPFDQKFCMQIRSELPALLEAYGGALEYREKTWINACMELRYRSMLSMLAVLRDLDSLIPNAEFFRKCSSREAMSMHCLRLLYYLRPKVGANNIVGQPHIDRCTFTGHLYDSRPGLFIHTPDGGCQLYETGPDRALIFPGGKASVIAPQLSGLGHEVCDDQFGSVEPRVAAVLFLHSATPLPEELFRTRRIPSRRELVQSQGSFPFEPAVAAA